MRVGLDGVCEAKRCRPRAKIAGAQEQMMVTETSIMLAGVRESWVGSYGAR